MGDGRDFAAFLESLQRGKPRPLYVVIGEDEGLREAAVAAVRRAVFGAETDPDEQNVMIFGPPDPAVPSSIPKVAEILDEVRTASLFAARKMVLLRGAGALLAPARKEKAAEHEDKGPAPFHAALLELLTAPPEQTVLVLETEKLHAGTKLCKALEESGGLVVCPKLYDTLYGETQVSMASPMGVYLAHLARSRSLQLARGAGERLLELADGQAGRLTAELDKLAEYLGGAKRPITAEDIEALASGGAAGMDPVIQETLSGDASAALRAVEAAFSRGLEDFSGRMVWDDQAIAIILVSVLTRRAFDVERTVLNGGRYVHAGKGKPPPPKVTRPVEAAARRWSAPGAMEQAYRLLLEAELEIKGSSGRSARSVVEELIIALSASGVPAAGC